MVVSSKLNIGNIIKKSTINGPGTRSVIWLQGCNLNCTGCFNQELREIKENNLVSVSELIDQLPLYEIEGVTISGGEPFLQPEPLLEFLTEIKRRGLSTMIYTGNIFSELLMSNNEIIPNILLKTDVLVDGPYIKGCKPKHSWAGSGNQKVYIFLNKYKKYEKLKPKEFGEITITSSGEIIETGFIEVLKEKVTNC